VFSHYALFNSDKYENQPFGKYVLSSPVLWRYGKEFGENVYQTNVVNHFGYFDRNESLDKEVHITVGSNEDNEFLSTYGSDIFGNFDSTITGAELLYERLKSHGVNVTYKVFQDKGHSDYVFDFGVL
jgi:hypothetical protein